MKYAPPRYLFRRYNILKKVKPGKNFLEIGAGNLMLSRELLAYFDEGTCVDFAPKLKTIHKSLPADLKSRLKPVVGDFFKLNLNKNYDCVVSCEVMEHVKDDAAFIKKITSLLKPGGQLIISVPAREKYWTVHDEVVGHVRRYEKDRLKKLFNKKHFDDVEIVSYGFPFIIGLWLMRSLHGKTQAKQKRDWSQRKQTQASGTSQLSKVFDLFAFISNKYVFFLPNVIASFFNNYNLSEGYIIVATRK